MEEIEVECRRWAAGDFYPMSLDDRATLLDPKIAGHEEAWWRVVHSMLVTADENSNRNLASGPLGVLLRVGGPAWLERVATRARSSDRVASALVSALSDWDHRPNGKWWPVATLNLLGERRTFETYCRRAAGGNNWEAFWAWEVVNELMTGQGPDWGWEFLLRLVDFADTEECSGFVAAGPVEDYVHSYGESHMDRIEAEAARNAKFRDALGGINYPNLPEDLLARLLRASGKDR